MWGVPLWAIVEILVHAVPHSTPRCNNDYERERERGMTSLNLNQREGKTFTGRRRRRRRKWRNTNAQWAKKKWEKDHSFISLFYFESLFCWLVGCFSSHLLTLTIPSAYSSLVVMPKKKQKKQPPWRGMTHFDYLMHVIFLFLSLSLSLSLSFLTFFFLLPTSFGLSFFTHGKDTQGTELMASSSYVVC